jgi:hypothetical protein
MPSVALGRGCVEGFPGQTSIASGAA